MQKINREDIHIISRHSNCTSTEIQEVLKNNIYSDVNSWKKFLQLFFISLGICFTTAGILFFFAYNWEKLHKFYKIGIIEGLIIITTLIVLFSKIKELFKNIILTGASILVGVLFAVFGQIYQTGANAYDFFLGWTMAITLWVVISNFAPLWLFFLTLINTTIILYSQQVASDWQDLFPLLLLFIVNTLFLISSIYISKIRQTTHQTWFTNLIALAACFIATIGISAGIFEDTDASFISLLLIVLLSYSLGIWYGHQSKNIFYFAIIAFSGIIMITSLLIQVSSEEAMIFLISLFIITSVTGTIKLLVDLQKKWNNA
ncbi:MAG: DUF2157 domain-containing protein [Urechidicola sp.]|nr:DUF2157 domain-containing protein [Urechidicola sp.]